MRDVIADIVRQTAGLVDEIRVVGSSDSTVIEGYDESRTVLVQARLKEPLGEFVGEFGIPNIGLLNGLINFPSYRTDNATFTVKRRQRGDREIVEEFQFRDAKGQGADYRLKSATKGFETAAIQWDISFEPDKSRLAEFQQLAKLYGEVEKTFGFKTENSNLVVQLGNDNSSTHRASMVLADEVEGDYRAGVRWLSDKFFSVMRAGGATPIISLSKSGVIRVTADTQYGIYNYLLLGEQRR